ncbi:hypothetical protein TcasGA2_TC034839 [Tribolium castaneum]|uniref:Uncharacterized protein n=1 Tax=Tribolium castaneum TaxID=7070 RepID=A0A139WD34_TRICA|nr:hypothetical protein TcasGA2_TC034839 [Tribolium castaneum]
MSSKVAKVASFRCIDIWNKALSCSESLNSKAHRLELHIPARDGPPMRKCQITHAYRDQSS